MCCRQNEGTTQNILVAITFDLKFTYVLVRWKESANCYCPILTLFKKKIKTKTEKIAKKKSKNYVLNVFVSFAASFLNNLKLKNILLTRSVFNVLIKSTLMLFFFQKSKKKKNAFIILAI
jgi:hypothetical protein